MGNKRLGKRRILEYICFYLQHIKCCSRTDHNVAPRWQKDPMAIFEVIDSFIQDITPFQEEDTPDSLGCLWFIMT